MCTGFSLKKSFNSFSLYRRKNYHDSLRSLFVAKFKMFHGLMNNPIYFIRCISYFVSFNMLRLYLWAIFRLITFHSKVKYTISNVIVIVTYQILYNIKILSLIPLYSRIKIKLLEVYYTRIKKVKDSRNRSGVFQRVPGGLGSQILWHSAHESGEVVSLTYRQHLPPGNVPDTRFH